MISESMIFPLTKPPKGAMHLACAHNDGFGCVFAENGIEKLFGLLGEALFVGKHVDGNDKSEYKVPNLGGHVGKHGNELRRVGRDGVIQLFKPADKVVFRVAQKVADCLRREEDRVL